MTDLQAMALLFCGAYFALMVFIGYFTGRNIQKDDFIIGDRNIGIIGTASSIGSGLRDVGFIWFWITFSFLQGYALIWIFVTTAISVFAFIPFARKLRVLAKERNYISPVELIRDRIGPYCEKTIGVSSVISVLILASAQFMVLGALFSNVFAIDPIIIASILFIITSFYLWNGGYKSIIRTDIVQSLFIAILLVIPFMIPNIEIKTFMQWDTVFSMGVWDTFFLCAPLLFYGFTGGDIYQRILSARDDKTVRWGLSLSIIVIIILSFGLILIGMALKSMNPDVQPQQALMGLFTNSEISPILLSIFLVVFVAMGMSTLDNNAYNVSSIILRNFKREKTTNRYALYSKIIITLFLGMAALISIIASDDIMNHLFGLISLYLITAPYYVISLLTKKDNKDKIMDIGLCLCWSISLIVYFYFMANGYFSKGFEYMSVPLAVGFGLSISWVSIRRIALNYRY